MAANLPIGCFVRIAKPGLQAIIDALKGLGYRVVGPTVSESAVTYGDIESVSELPIGWTEEQEAGTYRLNRNGADTYFAYVVGPHSLKNHLYPPRTTILESIRSNGAWTMKVPGATVKPLAVIGPRACDLHALAMQDRIFLADRYVNPEYAARREGLFVLAVQCERAAPTCFCNSMQCGPMATDGFDLAITELPDHFVLEVGSERGGEASLHHPGSGRGAEGAARHRACHERTGRRQDRGAGRPPHRVRRPARPPAREPRRPAVGRGRRAVPRLRQLRHGLPHLLLLERARGGRPDRRPRDPRAGVGHVL